MQCTHQKSSLKLFIFPSESDLAQGSSEIVEQLAHKNYQYSIPSSLLSRFPNWEHAVKHNRKKYFWKGFAYTEEPLRIQKGKKRTAEKCSSWDLYEFLSHCLEVSNIFFLALKVSQNGLFKLSFFISNKIWRLGVLFKLFNCCCKMFENTQNF